MINFCCVYYGDKYPTKYVQVLYNMVNRYLTLPHKFICFTDHVKLQKIVPGIEARTFPEHNLEGWWNKLQLFHPKTKLKGVNFYMDLDVVVLQSIDKFIEFSEPDEFSIIRDFGQPQRYFNSSVMKWNNDFATEMIWEEYQKNLEHYKTLQGDQNVITDAMNLHGKKILKPYPDEWTFSYKWTHRKNPKFGEAKRTYEVVDDASIAVFHGKPNPHESEQKWVKDNWK